MFRKKKCQACKQHKLLSEVVDDDNTTYKLCSDCSTRLNSQTLRPIEWYNLAAYFGWNTYQLHDDFYDQNGIASILDEPILLEAKYLAPTLCQASKSSSELVDYCMTRCWLGEDEYSALKVFSTHQVLDDIVLLAARGTGNALTTAFQIAANVIGENAGNLIIANYDLACKMDILFRYGEAAASCLPHPIGFQKLQLALAKYEGRALYERIGAMIWFRNKDVLSWIESNVHKTSIGSNWGQVAAFSNLSWEIIELWLTNGRPLSLVALDALSDFIPSQNKSYVLRELNPALHGVVDRTSIQRTLENYLLKDDVPRVTKRCEYIINNLSEIRMLSTQ